jgi:GH15 family glucan-1,4-alpha-glucosidase
VPRDIPIGNGTLSVNFDRNYAVRDVYFPHVGMENHTNGRPCRLGLWVDGRFSWVHGDDWRRTLGYDGGTLVTKAALENEGLGIRVEANDAVHHEIPVFLRHLRVFNPRPAAREVRIFFATHMQIYGNEIGDTVYYDPEIEALVHYKNERWFLEMAQLLGKARRFFQFACGYAADDSSWGTWVDAEDGDLQGNAISQGSVDSCFSLTMTLPAAGKGEVLYWMTAGYDYFATRDLAKKAETQGPLNLLEETRTYWQPFCRVFPGASHALSEAAQEIYCLAPMVIATHIDRHGAIVASTDSDILKFGHDTYNYCWPRDAALVARALTRAAYPELAHRVFQFFTGAIAEDGWFFHKYNPNGSAGSSWQPWFLHGRYQLPIQEYEVGLPLWALWKHVEATHEQGLVKEVYDPLVARAADFMVRFRKSGLPLPSYDLWEERRGVLLWTTSAVVGGLRGAAALADMVSRPEEGLRWREAAGEVREAMLQRFWMPDQGRFARMILPTEEGGGVDSTIDASLLGLFLFDCLPADDPRMRSTAAAVERGLWVKTPVGGLARYAGDAYQKVTDDPVVPGNPWFITTLWLAQWYTALAQDLEGLRRAGELIEWAASHALPSGIMAEQLHPFTGQHLSVSPLIWSHAEFITAVTDYMEKWASLSAGEASGGGRTRTGGV